MAIDHRDLRAARLAHAKWAKTATVEEIRKGIEEATRPVERFVPENFSQPSKKRASRTNGKRSNATL
jgi:hypothetical protein